MNPLSEDIRRQIIILMRAKRYSVAEIAAITGVANSTVYRITDPVVHEKQNEQQRKSKAQRRGICIDCGAPTYYSGRTAGGVSRRCWDCGHKQSALTQRGRGFVMQKVVDFLSQDQHTWNEIRNTFDIPRNQMGPLISRLMKQGRIQRVRRGIYEATR